MINKRSSICREGEYRVVEYDSSEWSILLDKRRRATYLMEILSKTGYKPYVYGSIARGDVHPNSDIDITFLAYIDPSLIETSLINAGIEIMRRFIVMATPRYTPKAYIWLHPEGMEQVSTFISKPQGRSVDFYRFGGLLDYNGLRVNSRVSGVNKRLMMIEPFDKGHVEWCIVGREGEAASKLNVSQEIVIERVRVLTRRRRVGHTGVYIEYELDPRETFGEAINYLKKENRFFRKIVE
jgi:hypothetical protein